MLIDPLFDGQLASLTIINSEAVDSIVSNTLNPQSGSLQSTRPSPSLSIPSPQNVELVSLAAHMLLRAW